MSTAEEATRIPAPSRKSTAPARAVVLVLACIPVLVLLGCSAGERASRHDAAADSSSPAPPSSQGRVDLERLAGMATWDFPVVEATPCTALDSVALPGEDTLILRPIRDGERFRCRITDTHSVTLSLKLDELTDGFRTISGLRVLDATDGTLQELATATAEPPPRGYPFLSTIDLDFDGRNELKLLSWWGGTGNTGWEVFRVDPTGRLLPDTVLGNGTDLQPLVGTRCLRAGGTAGMAGGIYGITVYCWEGGRLARVYDVDQTWDEAGRVFLRRGKARLPGSDTLVLVRLDTVRDSAWR